MPDTSRDPSLLLPDLLGVWEYGKAKWGELYPDRPQPFITCTYRGPIAQQAAFERGASRARYGQSKHNLKPALAFDIAFLAAPGILDWTWDLFSDFADLVKPLGVVWGGDWPMRDGPHFELGD